MSKSPLATESYPAYSGNYTVGRSGRKIEAITIHHMAGKLTARGCGSIFQTVGRCGSSHYGIGYNGEIASYVDESNTAWTNSNWDSNCKSVTIETANDENGGNWHVSDKSINSLIKLVADIAKRNNLGTLVKGKNVTWHSMFYNTNCPGPYLMSKLDYIISEANKINSPKNVDYTGVITYQVYTNKWLPEVNKCDNTDNGYAGIYGQAISGLRCKPQYGEITYEAHTLNGNWLPKVSSKNYSSGGDNSYAGIYNTPIDAIKIKSTKGYVEYRVHVKGGNWLPWVDSRTQSGSESYAGIYGKAIDGIQMK